MDRYQKVKKIGEGSFGKAYLVKAKKDGQQYVIKEINIVRMSKKERDEARKEVALLAQMKHPNIVTYRESFEETGCLFICMDYCDGGDLYSRINAQRGVLFSEEQVLDWFVQICFAIKYVHDRKILHRDIKSQNIFLSKSGSIKLGDFGIAKVLNSTVELARTCIGTPYYLSPEICENKPYNNKSDIWSLGCVLYEMTTLKHAFEAGNMKNLVFKIVRGSYPPVSSKYSYELRNVIALLFKRSPRERPSANVLLRKPFLVRTVQKFMNHEVIAKELDHTVVHGKKVAKDLRALPPPPVAQAQVAKKVHEKRAAPQKYDPSSIYGVPAARRSRDNPARKSRESSRKSADAEKKRVAAAAAAVAAANNDIARKRRELLEKERIRREQQKEKEFAQQHKALMDKQKVARINKAREEGWKNIMESHSSNEEERSHSGGQSKTPQGQIKRNIPSPQPAAMLPPKPVAGNRGSYEHYHEYLDMLKNNRGVPQPLPSRNDYMGGGQPPPQVAAQQAAYDRKQGAVAAERARVVEEFMNRKKEAAFNKARGQANVFNQPKQPPGGMVGGGDARPKRPWEEIDAKNEQEKEYLARLKQIRLQNFNDRRAMRNAQKGGAPGLGVKGALNADDAEIRKKKIEALKAQAEDRAKRLKEQLEQKRREAYERGREAQKAKPKEEEKPVFPVVPPKKVEPAPVIPMTEVMKAIGAKPDVEKSAEKSPLQKKKEEILKRFNEKPRSKWAAADEHVPALANMELEETGSAMEATSARDSVMRVGEKAKPSEERKKWGEPKPADDIIPSARRQWSDPHDTLINKLKEADIQKTSVAEGKVETDIPGVGKTIIIEKPSAPPKIKSTFTFPKDEEKESTDGSKSEASVPDEAEIVVRGDKEREQEQATDYQKPGIRPAKDDSTPANDNIDAGATVTMSTAAGNLAAEGPETKNSDEFLHTEDSSVIEPGRTSQKEEPAVAPTPHAVTTLPVQIERAPAPSPKPVVNARTVNLQLRREADKDSPSENEISEVPPLAREHGSHHLVENDKSEAVPYEQAPKEAWDEAGSSSPTAKFDTTAVKVAVPSKPGTTTDVDKAMRSERSEGGKLFDKVELQEDEDIVEDDMTVEDYEEEGEKATDFKKTMSGMMMGLTIGHYDLKNTKMLRTCSLPDLSKLSRTSENKRATIRYSFDLAAESQVEDDEVENVDDDKDEIVRDQEVGGDDDDVDGDNSDEEKKDGDDDDEEDEKDGDDNDEDEKDGDDEEEKEGDEEDEDLASVMETMESLLLEKDDDSRSGSGEGSDTTDTDRDSATTTGGSSIINTIVPGQEEWCSDEDDVDGANDDEDSDMFGRLEEIRAQMEEELGCDKFLDAYRAVQAVHEDEDENIEDGEKIAMRILGPEKRHLYNKILQLVMADGAYLEDNE